MPSQIKAVIWDMGGVILRTDEKKYRAQLGRKYGLSTDEVDELVFNQKASMQASLGLDSEEKIWENVAKTLNLNKKDLSKFRENFWRGDRVDVGLVNFIDNLRPKYKTALLSNAWVGARKTLTEKYDCIHIFDVTVISAEVGVMKPDPKIYYLVLEKLKVLPEQSIFVDDSSINVEAANQIGIHGIRFLSTPQVLGEIQSLLNLKS